MGGGTNSTHKERVRQTWENLKSNMENETKGRGKKWQEGEKYGFVQ
jgi:hypothetical protein